MINNLLARLRSSEKDAKIWKIY